MVNESFRIERDSLGDVRVPDNVLFGAQTQRAVDNFRISGWRFPRPFIRALALIKRCAAAVNEERGLLTSAIAPAIRTAAQEVEDGAHDEHFPIDIFQTGSGTSTNMNANEIIARLASLETGQVVHANDHVNMSQSSNDVIPTAIHVSAYLEVTESLIPALQHLQGAISRKPANLDDVVVTGRTHLMDALPLRLSQELEGWSHQIHRGVEGLQSTLPRLAELAVGGTAVGTGLNAPPEFGRDVAAKIAMVTGAPFVEARNRFALLSSQDSAVELSGQLRTVAVIITKIATDLRWMNSGPVTGLGEIALPALQPGSSMMPGKVNPVIPEAVTMACAQVIGNDVVVTVAGQAGNFQLNVMLPVIAHNLLQSAHLLATSATALADKAIAGFTVNRAHIVATLERNPILGTVLAPRVGYETAAKIVQRAYAEQLPVKRVAAEMTDLSSDELDRLLDVRELTRAGLPT